MAIDTSAPRTRRALLAGGLGGLVAFVAAAVGRPLDVRAGSDGDVVLGAVNAATSTTVVQNTTTAVAAFKAACLDADGVVGYSNADTKSGVYGFTDNGGGYGVFGRSQDSGMTGSLGSAEAGVRGDGRVGVVGMGDAATGGAVGVWGMAYPRNDSCIAGVFQAMDPKVGYALRAVGRVKLDNAAGVVTIAAGSRSKWVRPGIDLASTSAVVATLLGSAGRTTTVHRVVVSAKENRFRIYLTARATRSVRVAWHVFGQGARVRAPGTERRQGHAHAQEQHDRARRPVGPVGRACSVTPLNQRTPPGHLRPRHDPFQGQEEGAGEQGRRLPPGWHAVVEPGCRGRSGPGIRASRASRLAEAPLRAS